MSIKQVSCDCGSPNQGLATTDEVLKIKLEPEDTEHLLVKEEWSVMTNCDGAMVDVHSSVEKPYTCATCFASFQRARCP